MHRIPTAPPALPLDLDRAECGMDDNFEPVVMTGTLSDSDVSGRVVIQPLKSCLLYPIKMLSQVVMMILGIIIIFIAAYLFLLYVHSCHN